MLDSALQTLLRSTLLSGLTVRGYPDVIVKASNQSRQMAVPTAATIYIYQMSSYRYGFPTVADVWDPVNSVFQETETQLMETKYQIGALSPQSPATPDAPTTDDLVRIAGNILQSRAAQQTLNEDGVGILRIQPIPILWFGNDRGQFDANPTFEIVLRHNDVFTTPVDAISNLTAGFYPI